jgi:acyl-CoA thioesterase
MDRAPPADDALQLAWDTARAMIETDRCLASHGIEVVDVAPGTAALRMTVREDMINGHDICHGGMIFTLADSCFAYACNSRNRATVAMSCDIDFMRPARLGDVLEAHGREIALEGRNGIYDIVVSDQHGQTVAHFRGKSRAIRGTVTGA